MFGGSGEAWSEALLRISDENKYALMTRRDFELKRDICFPLPPQAIDPRLCKHEKHLEVYSKFIAENWDNDSDLDAFKRFELGLARPLRIPLVSTGNAACIDVDRFRSELAVNLGVETEFIANEVLFNLQGGDNRVR
jgi:hypothetical protein